MNNTNLDTYADPPNYDREGSPFDMDGSLLLKLAAEIGERVLELGCGTGRVTIPLAKQGIAVTGLDVLPHMIEWARKKAADLPIEWVCDDVRSFRLDRKFGLIFTVGGVFQHLLAREDQEAMLQRVREHLAPDGQFMIDVGFKRPEHMVDVPEEQEWYSYTDDQGVDVKVAGCDRFDHEQQIWHQTYTRRWQEEGEQQTSRPIELALRYIMPQEMEALLHYNGFRVLARYGDWQGNPFTEKGFLQVYVCEKRQ